MHLHILFYWFSTAIALDRYLLEEFADSPEREEPAPLHKAADEDKVIPGKYIVRLKNGTDSSHRDEVLGRLSAGTDHVYRGGFHGFARSLDERELEVMLNHEHVEYVAQDSIVTGSGVEDLITNSWALSSLSHNTTWFGPLGYTYFRDDSVGEGTCSYVLDTGIEAKHHDFWQARVKLGRSFVEGETEEDENGHGTHVAGIIGGNRFGVAKKTILYSVKVLDKNKQAPVSTLIKGLEFVPEDMAKRDCPKGVMVNLSFSSAFSQALNDAVAELVRTGVFVAVSAGDMGKDVRKVSPASVESACTVGAIDEHARLFRDGTSRSNFGSYIDVFAPGKDIWSTTRGDSFAMMSGSSQATAFVSGLAAYLATLEGLSGSEALCGRIRELAVKNRIADIPRGTNNLLAFNGMNSRTLMSTDIAENVREPVVELCAHDNFKPPCALANAPAGKCVDMPAGDYLEVSSLWPSRNAGVCRFYIQFHCKGDDSFQSQYSDGGENLVGQGAESMVMFNDRLMSFQCDGQLPQDLPHELGRWTWGVQTRQELCPYFDQLQVRVRLSDGFGEGTSDTLKLEIVGQRGELHVVAMEPPAGFDQTQNIDLLRTFGSSTVQLRDIRKIQLHSLKTGFWGGDKWGLRDIHLRGRCGPLQEWVENSKFSATPINKELSPGRDGRVVGKSYVAWESFTGPEDWVPKIPCTHFSKLSIKVFISSSYRSGTWNKITVEIGKGTFTVVKQPYAGYAYSVEIDLRKAFDSDTIAWRDITTLTLHNSGNENDDVKIDKAFIRGQCSGSHTIIRATGWFENWMPLNGFWRINLGPERWSVES
ncbi:hypothetical protein XA68_11782 [Ophiocordyceps unilateralis]|uniref:Peptidase S8/S53 domain-containing protein n=1 Tax=Ophiocordyceps unilateralis TaxID=268505 RepID=A0A2A9PG10_OPHUN|nr:hypothetical protein XA68_11782 [Ophiocordyceps unilateralis]